MAGVKKRMKRLSITTLVVLLGVLGLAWIVSLALSSGTPSTFSVAFDAFLTDAPARISSAWQSASLPHPGLVAAGIAGVLVLIGAYFGCRTASQRVNEKARRAEEASLKEQVAAKAKRTVATATVPSEASSRSEFLSGLTESGVFSLLDVVDTCIANGQFDQALQWTRHAIRTSPGAYEFEVKLAEVYYKMGDLEGFLPLTQRLHEKLHQSHPQLWQKVVRMGSEIVPMHPLFCSRNSAKAGK
jgi:hypothetical protein